MRYEDHDNWFVSAKRFQEEGHKYGTVNISGETSDKFIVKKSQVIWIHGEASPTIVLPESHEVTVLATSRSVVTILAPKNATAWVSGMHLSKLTIKIGGGSRIEVRSSSNHLTTIERIGKSMPWAQNEKEPLVLLTDPRGYNGDVNEIIVKTPEQWCRFYGVKIVDGIALLSKNVQRDYSSNMSNPYTGKQVFYIPGRIPVAEDWDGGIEECGRGLHFSPTHEMAGAFAPPFRRIVCPVRLTDIAVHPTGSFPEKCKAKGCCEPVWEVDENGEVLNDSSAMAKNEFFEKHGGK